MSDKPKALPSERDKERRWRDISLATHPVSVQSADGSTTLQRFEAIGLVYATDLAHAFRVTSEWNLGPYLGACKVALHGTELIEPPDHADRLELVKRFAGFHIGSEGWGEEIIETYFRHPEDAKTDLQDEGAFD